MLKFNTDFDNRAYCIYKKKKRKKVLNLKKKMEKFAPYRVQYYDM